MDRTFRKNLTAGIAVVAGTLGAATTALSQERAPMTGHTVEGVTVETERQEDGLSSPMRTQPLLDTPQTTTVLDERLMREEGVTRLRDAMRNVTGVSILAGEGNPPSGDSMKIRGFIARDDILVDGMQDVGNYLRDPFFADTIEVTQGPSSAYAGRGNTGGTVNLVTRQPVLDYIRRAEFSVGTDNLYRATVDANYVLDEEHGVALRLNMMGHRADEPGRDHVYNGRWGLNASLAVGLETDTVWTMSLLHVEQNEIPDLGIPTIRDFSMVGSGVEGRPAPVDRSNFYGYSTDYRDIIADVFTVRFSHEFNNGMSLMSQMRYGRTLNDSMVSAPRIFGQVGSIPAGGGVGPLTTVNGATQINGLRKPRDEIDTIIANQTNLTMPFATGGLDHTFVVGFEVSRDRAENRRRLDANGPAYNLFDPGYLPANSIAYNGTEANIQNDAAGIYVFDNIELNDQWELNFGARYDQVHTRVQGIDYSGLLPAYNTDLSRTDGEWSGNASVLFHPTENSALYLGWGTSFEPSGRYDVVQIAGRTNDPPVTFANFQVEPERSESVEFGGRLHLGQMQYSAAVFRTEKTNARTPGVNPGDPPVVLDGVQRVDGFTLGMNGEIMDRWAVFANYTYLDGEVISSNNPFEIGQRLDNLPQHSFSLWSTYQMTPRFRVGGGFQYVGERSSNIRPNPTADLIIRVPDYSTWDAFALWRVAEEVELQLNLYNLTDEHYFQSFQPGQAIPAATRSAVLQLAVGF